MKSETEISARKSSLQQQAELLEKKLSDDISTLKDADRIAAIGRFYNRQIQSLKDKVSELEWVLNENKPDNTSQYES